MKAKFVRQFLYEFERGEDPRHSMNLGRHSQIQNWFDETWTERWDKPPKWKLNRKGEIDIDGDFSLPWRVDSIPEFIKFGTVTGDFKVTRKRDVTDLDWFPSKIMGDLEFYANGIRPSLEDLQKISDIQGDVELESYEQKKARLSRQRMKERGPLRSRKSHDLSTYPTKPSEYGPKYSRGYKLYQVLKAIEAAGDKGLRNKEIRKILKELTYGPGTYDSVEDRGWGSWYFSGPGGTGLQDKTTSPSRGVYVLSPGGKKYLEEYKDIFDK